MVDYNTTPFRLEFRNKNTEGEWHILVQSQNIGTIFEGVEQRIHNFNDNQYQVTFGNMVLWESGHTVVMDTGLYNYSEN